MTRVYTVSVDGELSDKEADKIRLALQKAVAPWFKKGHAVRIEA